MADSRFSLEYSQVNLSQQTDDLQIKPKDTPVHHVNMKKGKVCD